MHDQLDDIESVVDHIAANFSNCLNINANSIQLLGESAGGQLSLIYGDLRADPNYVKSIISMYAPTNMNKYADYLASPESNFICGEVYEFVNCNYVLEAVLPYYPWYFYIDESLVGTYFEWNYELCNAERERCLYFIDPFSQDIVYLNPIFNVVNNIQNITIIDATYIVPSALSMYIASDLSTSSYIATISPHYTVHSNYIIPTFVLHGDSDLLVPFDVAGSDLTNLLNIHGGLVNGGVYNGTDSGIPSTYDFSTNSPRHVIKIYDRNADHGFNSCSNDDKEIIRNDIVKWIKGHE